MTVAVKKEVKPEAGRKQIDEKTKKKLAEEMRQRKTAARLNNIQKVKKASEKAQKKAADQTASKKAGTGSASAPKTEAPEKRNLNMSSVLGDVCWLLSQSPAHRYNFFMADIEWMVFPPIMHGQYKLFQSDNRPAGFAMWANVSDEVQKKLEAGIGKLSGQDWKSGDNLWLIDIISPYGHADQMLADLKQSVFKGKSFKYHRTSPDGAREVIAVQPE